MVRCFSCQPKFQEDLGPEGAKWSADLVQDLYTRCTRSNDGQLIVYGLFARANAVNDNRRLYPKSVLSREVKKYVRNQIRNGCALGELDHPSYSSPTFKCLNLANISHQVLDVKWKGNTLWGYIQVLDTPSGRLVRSLYEQGYKLGVSSRGWASLRELPGKQYKCIMDNFELITFDFVTEPSTHGAWLLPYSANYLGSIPPQGHAEDLSCLGVGALPIECIRFLPDFSDAQQAAAGFAYDVQSGHQRFPAKRMTGPEQWCVAAPRKQLATDIIDSDVLSPKPSRPEPAATDLTNLSIVDHICPGMAENLLQMCSHIRTRPSSRDPPTTMHIPKAVKTQFQVRLTNGELVHMRYGTYAVFVVHFGVPKQRGLRDYWRHAYLFKERAIAGNNAEAESTSTGPRAPSWLTPEGKRHVLYNLMRVCAWPT